MYDPTTNGDEWIPICSTMSDLSQVEEKSALALCNMIPHSPGMQSRRLNRFGEDRMRDNTEEEDSPKERESP